MTEGRGSNAGTCIINLKDWSDRKHTAVEIIKELEADPNVLLTLEGKDDLFISVSGKAKLIRDKASFAEHWVKDLDRWFSDGIDSKGLVLIHVKGNKIHYWQKEKEGEIAIGKR